MKKSSGSGDRPRPISLLPGADLAWVMGVQLNQTPNSWRANRTRDPIRRHEALQPVSISLAGEEDPNRVMNGQIGLAARIPRANTEWTGSRIWVWLEGMHPRKWAIVAYQPKKGPVLALTDLCPHWTGLREGRGAAGGDPARRAGGIDTPAVLWSAATRRELVKAWCGGGARGAWAGRATASGEERGRMAAQRPLPHFATFILSPFFLTFWASQSENFTFYG